MRKDDLRKLLELYSLEEIFEGLSLEPIEVLELLSDQGFFSDFTLPEPV